MWLSYRNLNVVTVALDLAENKEEKMTTSGKKNTVNTIAREIHNIENKFNFISKEFAALSKDCEHDINTLSESISNINEDVKSNLHENIVKVNARLDLIERALLMSPVKRWWMTFRGRLLS